MTTHAAERSSEPRASQMSTAGLRAFTRIAALWGLSIEEQLALLGEPARSTYFAWRKNPERATLPRDTLERMMREVPGAGTSGIGPVRIATIRAPGPGAGLSL